METKTTMFYRMPRVREICGGVSASYIWAMVKKEKFPKPIKLSENCTAWEAAAVEAWAQSRIAASQSAK